MAYANDSITITPGSGATVATHLANGKEHQVVVLADASGHLIDTLPVYKLIIPSSAAAANKVHADMFNGSGSGAVIEILSITAYPDIDTAVTGTLGVEIALTRTKSVGTGGTAAVFEGTALNTPTFARADTASPALPSQITARAAPTGGATAGAYLGSRWVFTEETNAGAAVVAAQGAELVRNGGYRMLVRENEGIRLVQGAVASVGSIAFWVCFRLI